MKFLTRNWQLKIVSLVLSMFLWMMLHYGRPPKKETPRRRAAAAARAASERSSLR